MRTAYLILLVLVVVVVFVVVWYHSKLLYAHHSTLDGPLDRDVVVSLTSVPPRIKSGRLRVAIDSLAKQTLPPTQILLNLPRYSKRFECDYMAPSWAHEYPTLQIHWCEKDYGPATKILGGLATLDPSTIVVFLDDDTEYNENLVGYLVKNVLRDPTSVFALHKGSKPDRFMGSCGVAFVVGLVNPKDMIGFHNNLPDACRAVDDVWMTKYFNMHGIEVKQTTPPVRFWASVLRTPHWNRPSTWLPSWQFITERHKGDNFGLNVNRAKTQNQACWDALSSFAHTE